MNKRKIKLKIRVILKDHNDDLREIYQQYVYHFKRFFRKIQYPLI